MYYAGRSNDGGVVVAKSDPLGWTIPSQTSTHLPHYGGVTQRHAPPDILPRSALAHTFTTHWFCCCYYTIYLTQLNTTPDCALPLLHICGPTFTDPHCPLLYTFCGGYGWLFTRIDTFAVTTHYCSSLLHCSRLLLRCPRPAAAVVGRGF